MAKNSTLTVKYEGDLLVGAEVFSTAKSIVSVTDGSGQITDSLADDYASVIVVAVRHSSLAFTFYVTFLLEAGLNYELNIPIIKIDSEATGYSPYMGLHSGLVTEL